MRSAAPSAEPEFVILLYHGVTSASARGIANVSRKHIAAAEFEAQMARLRRDYRVLPVRELLARKREGRLAPRAVAVTFDDGFENNFAVAFPILRRYQIPATFYLATGFIGATRVFWVDKVEYLLNETVEESLRLETLGAAYPLRTSAERAAALGDIKTRLKSAAGLIADTVAELETRAGVPPRYDYPDYRTLDWDQVRAMHRSGLCDFGGHTVDHEILSHLPADRKQRQILDCKAVLERELECEAELFSYPEGQPEHFDEETVRLLLAAGFTSSPSAVFGVNRAGTSDFHLRRNMVEFTAPFRECLEVFSC